ncbi:MAG TPA: type II toxin-antitoxin system prevent-host-death family antitoxin [Bryobacteraceae bacterium]
MAKYHISQAKTNFSALVAAAEKGEEVVITRYGKPVARITGIKEPKERVLGSYPMHFTSDLMEPTDPEVVDSFYK